MQHGSYVGVDAHKNRGHVAVMDQDGNILQSADIPSSSRRRERARAVCQTDQGGPGSIVRLGTRFVPQRRRCFWAPEWTSARCRTCSDIVTLRRFKSTTSANQHLGERIPRCADLTAHAAIPPVWTPDIFTDVQRCTCGLSSIVMQAGGKVTWIRRRSE